MSLSNAHVLPGPRNVLHEVDDQIPQGREVQVRGCSDLLSRVQAQEVHVAGRGIRSPEVSGEEPRPSRDGAVEIQAAEEIVRRADAAVAPGLDEERRALAGHPIKGLAGRDGVRLLLPCDGCRALEVDDIVADLYGAVGAPECGQADQYRKFPRPRHGAQKRKRVGSKTMRTKTARSAAADGIFVFCLVQVPARRPRPRTHPMQNLRFSSGF